MSQSRHRRRSAHAALVICVAFTACAGEPDAAWQVGDVDFSEEQVGGMSEARLDTLADLTAFGQAVAGGALQELGEPLVARDVERARLRRMPAELGARAMGLDDDGLESLYRDDPEWELEVRHMVRLADEHAPESEREEARGIAEEVARRAEAGEDFAALAAEYSEELRADERGGQLEPGREGTWVGPFWEAASALEPGETSPVVRTQYGYHVIRLEERRPVPFEEASRARLLEMHVPPDRASDAMADWAEAREAGLRIDPPALARARRALDDGNAPDTLAIASWPDGQYSALCLAVYRASLDAGARGRLMEGGDAGFGRQVENDAREFMWADGARGMGVRVPDTARAEAEVAWQRRALTLAAAIGFAEGQSADMVREQALAGLTGGDQEARIARLELAALRPLLRRSYPVSGSDGARAALPPSSSDAPTSDRNR